MVCLRLGLEAAASTEAAAAAADVVDVVVAAAAAAAAADVAAACRLEDAEISLESASSDQTDVSCCNLLGTGLHIRTSTSAIYLFYTCL